MKKIKYILYLISIILNKKKFLNKISSQNQNQESNFLENFIKQIDNKTFIEFGFHPFEFNTINLMTNYYKGTLVDGNKKNVFLMKLLNFFYGYNVQTIFKFLNRENVINIFKKKYGIFSIDIDGNDYWIVEEILNKNINFELIIVEYNSSFLDKFITVPYDPCFNRHKKHSSGWYHGASLNAFIKLFDIRNYALVKTIGGNNAFFVNRLSLDKYNLKELKFEEAFEESKLRNQWSNTSAKEQFEVIKNLEFIEV